MILTRSNIVAAPPTPRGTIVTPALKYNQGNSDTDKPGWPLTPGNNYPWH
jgi:hypothetical protein